jgi:hypothetical protein
MIKLTELLTENNKKEQIIAYLNGRVPSFSFSSAEYKIGKKMISDIEKMEESEIKNYIAQYDNFNKGNKKKYSYAIQYIVSKILEILKSP